MTDCLNNWPTPQPDVERFKAVLRRERPDRVPLVELAIADEVLGALIDEPLAGLSEPFTSEALDRWAGQRVNLWYRLGYDYYRVRAEIPFIVRRLETQDTSWSGDGIRRWTDEGEGVIQSAEDVERYLWPEPADVGFAQAEAAIRCLPDGMGAIGFSGGVLEWATTLLGLENYMILSYENPALIREVVDRVGRVIHGAIETFCHMDAVFAIWLGDDMGFKTATLVSPDHLREYILPWHRRYAELAHAAGRFFLLHSCGHVEAVMPDLIDDVHIDAKHSFEDGIVPVEQFQQKWGDQVAVLGGIDVDLLGRGSPAQVRDRTRQVLDACAPRGGYACGSGNSITNYIRPANYLAMVEAIHQFNGRR